jgi:glycosyltransferase involved in cell wall biosynthesis
LLLVYPFIPYPPDNGGRIGFWNPIKYLSRRHDVHIAFLAEEADREHWGELEKKCASVQGLFRIAPPDVTSRMRSLLGYPPGTSRRYWDPRFLPFLTETIKKRDIQLVEFHHLHTAAYRDAAGSLPTVLREHNVEYMIWQRHARSAGMGERAWARLLAPRVQRYEAEVAPRFDRCVVVSKADEGHLKRVCPSARIEMIPSGVDREYFFPISEVEESHQLSMVYVGAFYWRPRLVNLRAILEKVMPRIRAKVPEAQLTIVGRGIPPDLQQLAARTHGVTLTGAVPDVRPYIQGASLVLNYVESGGGIALKVLEALAMRRPVLSNSLGCEGINVQHGRDVFLADGPEDFADAAAKLLSDTPLRRRIAQAGYELVRQKYGWDVIANQFGKLYDQLAQTSLVAAPTSR